MTLDEYLHQLVQRIEVCRDETMARRLINEAAYELNSNRTSRDNQARFWQKLDDNLRSAAKKPDPVLGKKSGVIVAVCRNCIAEYRAKLGDKTE